MAFLYGKNRGRVNRDEPPFDLDINPPRSRCRDNNRKFILKETRKWITTRTVPGFDRHTWNGIYACLPGILSHEPDCLLLLLLPLLLLLLLLQNSIENKLWCAKIEYRDRCVSGSSWALATMYTMPLKHSGLLAILVDQMWRWV